MLVNGTLNDLIDDPHSHCLRFTSTGLVGDVLPCRSHVDIFPKSRVEDVLTTSFQLIQPHLLGLLTRIPFDDEPGTILNQDSQVFGSIVPGIHPDQQRLIGHAMRYRQGLLQKLRCMSLTMLLPLSKLDVRHEAFRTNIGNH